MMSGKGLAFLSCTAFFIFWRSPSATANGSESTSDSLQEVVVTAEKREERLQEVPISLVVLSQEELTKRNITNIDELRFLVPGLSFNENGQNHTIYLRGIANDNGLPLVGMYLDEADLTASIQPDVNLYDLKRVEVLRGPQGTLYGEGSMGGTIRFITNDPSLNAFQLDANVAALFTQDGAPGQRIQEVLNVPLVENYLAIRVAGQFEHDGGWINQPAASQTDINQKNTTDVRTKILWEPTTGLSVSALAEIHRSAGGLNTQENVLGTYTQAFDLTTTHNETRNFGIYNLTLTDDLGFARLVNTITNFDESINTYNYGYAAQFTPPPSPQYNVYLPLQQNSEHSTTDELRLTSNDTGPWRWNVGAYFRDDSGENGYIPYYVGLPGGPLPSPYSGLYATQNAKAESLFGDTSYKLFDRLTLGAGVRAYRDEVNPETGQTAARFRSIDPRFYADMKLDEQVNVYASGSKGFRSGGFNQPGQPNYNPEEVWTYEWGTKTSFLDNHLKADLAVFYSTYLRYQVTGISLSNFLDITSNAGDAKIKGVEATVSWRAAEGWTLSANGDYLNAHFTSLDVVPASSNYLVGDPLDFVPRYSGTASVEHDFSVGDHPSWLRLDYSIQGPSTFRLRTVGPWFYSESDIINLVDISSGFDWNSGLSFGFLVQNLLNDRGYIASDSAEDSAPRERPRTYGINFTVKFR
jgi:iron complex outermembrane receptor protein